MFIKRGEGAVSGVFGTVDGYIDAGKVSLAEVVDDIIKRHAMITHSVQPEKQAQPGELKDAPKVFNLNTGDVFHHPGDCWSTLSIDNSSMSHVELIFDFSEMKPQFAGYVLRFNSEDWHIYHSGNLSFSISASPNIRKMKLEVKRNASGLLQGAFSVNGIRLSENTETYSYRLADYVSNPKDLENIAEVVFLLTPDSGEGKGKITISDVKIE